MLPDSRAFTKNSSGVAEGVLPHLRAESPCQAQEQRLAGDGGRGISAGLPEEQIEPEIRRRPADEARGFHLLRPCDEESPSNACSGCVIRVPGGTVRVKSPILGLSDTCENDKSVRSPSLSVTSARTIYAAFTSSNTRTCCTCSRSDGSVGSNRRLRNCVGSAANSRGRIRSMENFPF